MAALAKDIEQARQRLRAGLRKQCNPNVSDAAINTAEEFLWQGSLAAQSEPDGKTLALYASHAADKTILNETLLRARIHDSVRMGIGDAGSIAQRVRAKSRGRNSTGTQAMVVNEGNMVLVLPVEAVSKYTGVFLFWLGLFLLVAFHVSKPTEHVKKSGSG